jgi:hypothetical protein
MASGHPGGHEITYRMGLFSRQGLSARDLANACIAEVLSHLQFSKGTAGHLYMTGTGSSTGIPRRSGPMGRADGRG